MLELEFTDRHGVDWYKYTCSYTDHEGRAFVVELWAKSDEDVELRIAALRNSLIVDGRICGVYDEDGTPLVESLTPDNDSGVVH